MQFTVTFIVLAIVGLIDAGYLVYKHYFEKKPLVCPIGHDCNVVVESRWGNMLGVRNEILGVLFYLGMLAGAGVLIFFPAWHSMVIILLRAASGIGVLFSAFLTYLQKYVIKDFCFYCLISALVTLFLFINAFVL